MKPAGAYVVAASSEGHALGAGPVLWDAAQRKVYPIFPFIHSPMSRLFCSKYTRPLRASRLYYKWLDRIQLGLPL